MSAVSPDHIAIELTQCLDARDGTMVVRLALSLLTHSAELAKAPFVVRVATGQGEELGVSPVTLGEYSGAADGLRGYWLHEHAISLRLPLSREQTYVVQAGADAAGNTAAEPATFELTPEAAAKSIDLARWATYSADAVPDYEPWFLARRATPLALKAQRGEAYPDDCPTFSIVVPLYRTPVAFFEEMAASVLGQSYPRLELILVNASPEDWALREAVDRVQYSDGRVKAITLPANLGITENTNRGVRAAEGDFVCFVDHDDVLEPDILYRYYRAIVEHPSADLLYCDEDKLLDGHYVTPFLKPDWNPDLLCSFNYVCHMLTVRASLLHTLDEPSAEYDGGQDYRLTLLASEQAREVVHVPGVLYHWRIHEGSTASSADAKDYTTPIGARVVQEHFDRLGMPAKVEPRPGFPNIFQAHYQVQGEPLVSIVIATKDSVPVLDRCIRSILDLSTYPNYEIIVVENNSTDAATFDYYRQIQADHPCVRVVTCETEGKLNVSRVNNTGVAAASGDYLLILNNDVQVITPDWIERLLGPCQREDVGAVGAKLLYPDDVIQHAGVVYHFHTDSSASLHGPDNRGQGLLMRDCEDYYHLYQVTQDISACSSACLLTKRSVYEGVGGFDEALPSDYNDVDYCLKVIGAGKLVVYEPQVELYHYESISRRGHTSGKAGLDFVRANGVMLQRYPSYYIYGDPYMNPQLAGKFYMLRRD